MLTTMHIMQTSTRLILHIVHYFSGPIFHAEKPDTPTSRDSQHEGAALSRRESVRLAVMRRHSRSLARLPSVFGLKVRL